MTVNENKVIIPIESIEDKKVVIPSRTIRLLCRLTDKDQCKEVFEKYFGIVPTAEEMDLAKRIVEVIASLIKKRILNGYEIRTK